MGARTWRTRQPMKNEAPPGDILLLVLALLSCLLGGWLLGYGASPLIRDWQTSEQLSRPNGAFSASNPASSRELPSWRNVPMTKSSGYER